ncbi:MAG: homogentisate phytyltransferase [Calditrichaeota bacterium]|nr:homogentisate phytyltransferase [Calditrichota bacterium]RQV92779.1 MAG: homogentisate phytyltransferase [bacterium]RQW07650.1 MAG: homogentisate phytyltransferase [Calditrichota bacterium]
MLRTLWRFSRPHTIIGTTLSIIALYLISIDTLSFFNPVIGHLLIALFSCLAGNIYIVGLNQIYDVEIDRINKPELPLPAGDLSVSSARGIVIVSGILSVGTALTQGIFLSLVVLSSLFLGTIYSLPPVRLKRFHFWAAFSIFTVRGFIINLGIYLHFIYIMSGYIFIPGKIWVLTIFMFGFGLIIAWYKDIPDVHGDRHFRIITFAVDIGQKTVFRIGTALLIVLYIGMILSGFLILSGINRPVFVLAHALILLVLLYRSRKVDPSEQKSMTDHYQFVWKLFYLEYIVFPASCLL